MNIRFISISSFVFLLLAVSSIVPMELSEAEKSRQEAFAILGATGWVPSMGRIPSNSSLRKSADQSYGVCIPSGRCYGTCCAPAAKPQVIAQKQSPSIAKLEIPREAKEQQERIDQLRGLLKKIVQSVGKSEAVKIVKTAIDESSDSDTESAGSIGSPNSLEGENIFEQFLKTDK